MNKTDWQNYKQNNLKKNWEVINNPWVFELYKMPLISFLKTIKGKFLFNIYI